MGYGGGQSLSSKPVLRPDSKDLPGDGVSLARGPVTSRQGRVFPPKPRKFQGIALEVRGPPRDLSLPHPSAKRRRQLPRRLGSMMNRSTAATSAFEGATTAARSSLR